MADSCSAWIRPALRPAMGAQAWRPATPSLRGNLRAIRQLVRLKVPVLRDDAPVPGQTYGASVHGELALWWMRACRPPGAHGRHAAPARHLLTDRGRINPGSGRSGPGERSSQELIRPPYRGGLEARSPVGEREAISD